MSIRARLRQHTPHKELAKRWSALAQAIKDEDIMSYSDDFLTIVNERGETYDLDEVEEIPGTATTIRGNFAGFAAMTAFAPDAESAHEIAIRLKEIMNQEKGEAGLNTRSLKYLGMDLETGDIVLTDSEMTTEKKGDAATFAEEMSWSINAQELKSPLPGFEVLSMLQRTSEKRLLELWCQHQEILEAREEKTRAENGDTMLVL